MFVVGPYLVRNASLAYRAVEEIFPAACLADSAQFAMELPLARVIIKEVTCRTEVFTEGKIAELAPLGWRLLYQTPVALY